MLNKNNEKHKLERSKNIGEDMISFMEIVLIIARQIKVVILVPTLLCSIMILYLVFFSKPIFTSTSKIMSSSSGGGNSQALGFAAKFGVNLVSSQSEPKWVYPEILKSRTLAKSLLKRKFDTREFGKKIPLLKILTAENDVSKVEPEILEIIGTNKFLDMIEISEDIITSILTLSVNASEPSFAAQLNKVLIEELDEHQRRYNKAKTTDAKQFIEERIINTEKELISAEESLKVFLDRNRRIENSPSLQLEQQRLSREVSVLIGVFTTLKQQLETTKIEEVKESDYVIVIDPPEKPMKKSKPRKSFLVIITGIIGLGLGIIFAFIFDFFSFGKEKDINKIIEAKNLVVANIKELFNFK